MSKLIKYKEVFVFFLFPFVTLTAFAQVPVISSFSPLSANIGATITINGSGFHGTASNNIVFFGAVKANVTAASATSLSVTVPAGATHQPISVTTNGLIAYSTLSFNVTFTAATAFTNNSLTYATGQFNDIGSVSKSFIPTDLDGNGKPDLIMVGSGDSILIYPNNSSGNNISIAGRKVIYAGIFNNEYTIADYDGDGKPDIAVLGGFFGQIRILRNTSIPGNISFDSPVTVNVTVPRPEFAVSGDVDGDGLMDLVVASREDSTVSVFRNLTAGSSISFAASINFRTGKLPGFVGLNDLDGDLKPDIVTTNYESNTISIFRNNSTAGIILLGSRIDIAAGTNPGSFCITDLDADQKNDLIVANQGSNSISSFLNNSSIGSITFSPRTDHIVTTQMNDHPFTLAAGDFDGDSKTDLALGCFTDAIYPLGFLLLLKNSSNAGNFSYSTFTYPGVGPVYSMSFCDMQGDAKPELAGIMPNDFSAPLIIYRNRMGEQVNVKLCPPIGNGSLDAGLAGNSYQWQVSTDSINFIDITSSSNYLNPNTRFLGLNNLPSSYTGTYYRCVIDGIPGEVFRIRFVNEWISSSSGNWSDWGKWSCNDLPDQYTDVVIVRGNVTLTSNTTVNSLTVLPGALLTVATGVNLTVIH